MTARHDKVVQELALWGEITKSKGKITAVTKNPRLNTETWKILDLLFVHKRNNQTVHTFVEITISMDNAMRHSRERKREKYRHAIADHASANPDIKVEYKIFVFGLLGAIPKKFESIVANITSKAKTDWLITQVHRALLVHNGMLWTTRDIKYNNSQLQQLEVDQLDEEFD